MRVIRDGLWLCSDCTYVACNGSYGMDLAAAKRAELEMAVNRIPHLVPNFDSETGRGIREFSATPCACCGSKLAGYHAKFAQLG
jgi:hypothetical protein